MTPDSMGEDGKTSKEDDCEEPTDIWLIGVLSSASGTYLRGRYYSLHNPISSRVAGNA